jgi:hypothetical protein
LTGEEEGVGVGVLPGSKLVGEESSEDGKDGASPEIPLSKEASDALVEPEQQRVHCCADATQLGIPMFCGDDQYNTVKAKRIESEMPEAVGFKVKLTEPEAS